MKPTNVVILLILCFMPSMQAIATSISYDFSRPYGMYEYIVIGCIMIAAISAIFAFRYGVLAKRLIDGISLLLLTLLSLLIGYLLSRIALDNCPIYTLHFGYVHCQWPH